MADDDIIELTDIVKEGHAPAPAAPAAAVQASSSASAAQDSAPAASSAAQMPDFGADLDELLQNYDKPAAKTPATDEAVPAPIVNQETTDHKVDPNEELDLPPLSDLDALLEELGVQDNSAPAVNAQPTALAGDELDAMPEPGLEEPAVQAPEAAVPAPAEPASDDDGIDLNELDALLDSVLASAPKPAQAAAPVPEPAAAPVPDPVAVDEAVMPEAEPAPQAKPAPAASAAPAATTTPQAPAAAAPVAAAAPAPLSADEGDVDALRAEVAALRAELDDLRANIDKYAAAAAAKVIREELAVIASSLE